MRELQYTPIVHGEMITEEYIRNMRAQDYIDRVAEARRRKFGNASTAMSTVMLIIIIVTMLTQII